MASNNDIPEMNLSNNYSTKPPVVPNQNDSQAKKDMEKTKKEIEKIKSFIVKKYSFVQAVSVIPPQAVKSFIDEEIGDDLPKEKFEKLAKKIHLNVIVPGNKEKKIPEIKKAIVDEIEKSKQDAWVYVKTPEEIWELCFDSKFELYSGIAMSFPLYDKGFLGAMRVAEIHKSMVVQKFEKYVVSYVMGGSLIRGDAVKTSDVDVFIIINDTDVKRMPRRELLERLRGIIYQYVAEAGAMAGVQNKLEPQIYLLTDFWEAVKDAHPVMFTFIRDGVPIYDRGTFMPWKSLLKMGKLKPSPEAIDMFMSMGDNTTKRAERMLMDIVMGDIYWGVITPSQALLMLYGLPPPTPKSVVGDMKKIFLEKEKMLEKKYIDILEEIVIKYYKGYEHGKVKKVSGKEVDKLLGNMEDYVKRMKELREQIDKRAQEKTIEQIYKDTFDLLENLTKKKSQATIVKSFEEDFVKTGKFSPQHLRILKNVVSARNEFKKGKLDAHKVDRARRDADILIRELIEYGQREELVNLEKGKMRLKLPKDKEGKNKIAEILNADGKTFLFKDNKIFKVGKKLEETSMEEVSKSVESQKNKKEIEINSKIFDVLKKELGRFEVLM